VPGQVALPAAVGLVEPKARRREPAGKVPGTPRGRVAVQGLLAVLLALRQLFPEAR